MRKGESDNGRFLHRVERCVKFTGRRMADRWNGQMDRWMNGWSGRTESEPTDVRMDERTDGRTNVLALSITRIAYATDKERTVK